MIKNQNFCFLTDNSIEILMKGNEKMTKNPVMNIAKGAVIGMAAGMAVGYIGKKAADSNPKLRKKANKAYKTFENIVDTAQYMFR